MHELIHNVHNHECEEVFPCSAGDGSISLCGCLRTPGLPPRLLQAASDGDGGSSSAAAICSAG